MEIRFGRGKHREISDLENVLASRWLVVYGRTASRIAWLHRAVAAKSVELYEFSVPTEPDVELISTGVERAKLIQATGVIAIGGGAVIDAGKAIAALAPASGDMFDHLEVVGKGQPLVQDPLPFVAVPSTAGTGAEVTKNAVISVPVARRKVSLRDNRMLPNLAIVDPELVDNCPKSITLASGLDAITQVIEPYLSPKANWLTDSLCRDAIPRGLVALQQLMDGEKAVARDEMSWVSLCGGLALANSGLGAVHGLAGLLGGVSPAPHGAVCGRLLPFVLDCNEERVPVDQKVRFSQVRRWIAEALDCDQGDAYDCLQQWSEACGLPGLVSMGVKPDDFSLVAASAGSSSSMKANPVVLTERELEDLLVAAQ